MEGFGQQLYKNIKWGLSPAVVCIYVVYHVDRQIDPLLPDIGPFEHWRLPQRLMSCIFFGFLVTGFSALPTLSISVSRSAWPLGKLHIVILGTTFIVGLIAHSNVCGIPLRSGPRLRATVAAELG